MERVEQIYVSPDNLALELEGEERADIEPDAGDQLKLF